MKILDINHLTLGYERKAVVEDLSFSLNQHDFLSIVGSNGSGKSTLVKGLLGLIKPISGTVTYYVDRKFIGYMPQESKVDAFFPASVFEVVLSGALNGLGFKPFFSKEDKKIVDKVLGMLSIEDLKYRSFADLSGGQRQKVLLARALAATTDLLVLDEPSNNLDQASKKELENLIGELNKKGLTIVMITHDLHHLQGNKVLSLEEDVFFGTIEEYERRTL